MGSPFNGPYFIYCPCVASCFDVDFLYGMKKSGGIRMLIEYISKAMSKAVYDKLEDETHSGRILQCPGVIAFASTECVKPDETLPSRI